MLLDTFDVIGRYLFNHPIIGTMEISTILMAAMILLGLGYTQSQKANIRIEILVSRYPPRVKAIDRIFVLFIHILGFSVCYSEIRLKCLVRLASSMYRCEVIKIPQAPL